jgi:hypothetical protein
MGIISPGGRSKRGRTQDGAVKKRGAYKLTNKGPIL